MAKRLIAGLVLVVLAVAGGFWWQQRRIDRAEMEAGLAASRTLSAVFERTGAIEVARLRGEAVTRVDGASGFGLFANVQTTRAPYTIGYTLDLGRLTAAAYRWNGARRVMVVTVPEPTIGTPAIDLAQARTTQNGLFISRTSGVAMQQRVAANLALAVTARAQSPENRAKAREAARTAVRSLVAAPLAAAGIAGVTVTVRLPGDDRPAGLNRERWDLSRPIADVLRQGR